MIIGFDAKRANANFTGLGNYSRFMVDTMAVMNISTVCTFPSSVKMLRTTRF